MAELKELSKKRKPPSVTTTYSLMGIFSPIKSQMHLHRNWSGQSQSQSDFTCGGNHQDLEHLVRKRKHISSSEDSSVGYGLSSVSIKDLHLRRVFSPSSIDGVIPNCLNDTENLRKSEVARSCLGGSQEAGENGDFEKLDISNEDFEQSTPPDAEILGAKQVVERNERDFLDRFLQKKQSENLQNHGRLLEKGSQEERNGMNYSIKSVLKPCSRQKLFKTPGSFSYRRLVPYFSDIEKDYSRSPTMGKKTENGFKEKQFLASNSQETMVDKSKTSGCSLEGHKNDSNKELKVVLAESSSSLDSGSPSIPVLNGECLKLELQVSCEDQNLNFSKRDSSSTVDDSHFNEENLAGASDKMLKDDGEFAKTNFEFPCSAQNLEVLDNTLPTTRAKCESCDYDKATQNPNDDTKLSEIEGLPKATICHSFEAQHQNYVNPVFSQMEGNRKCSLQQRFENDGEAMEQVDDLNGECMSMTLPDSDMFSKNVTDDSRGNRVDHVSQDIGYIVQKSTDETFHRNNFQGTGKSLGSNPKNKLVPNPRMHLKLSKISGSFSYRRLLPFLMDIANDYSCVSGNDQLLEVEKSYKEKPLSPHIASGKDACMETFNGKSCPIKHHTGDNIMLPVVAASATRCASNHKLAQPPPKQVCGTPMILDSQQEQGSPVKPAVVDTNQDLETSPKNVVESPAMSLSSLMNSGLLAREEGAKSVAYGLPLETEEDCIKSTQKCADHEKQIEANSFVKSSNPSGIPSAVLKKGILKRNSRGCRGICNCLNCSSFRLHTEMSFKFSRNQMQDAEEVAFDLIKELSYLRNILEKYTFGAENQTSMCIHQIKEACKKASDAEELAKTRLSKMNYDLNVHCRIPCGHRPSVRFAHNVEEQIITVADSSNK
ncbi:hypothetical protein DITRI_Ditri15bG0046100 [Diplodiscus trichospermus]